MTEILTFPTKRSTVLVQFSYGNPTKYARYTNFTTDWVGAHDANTYAALGGTTMTVKLPTYTGGLKEKDGEIELDLDSFTSRISDGYPHAPVEIVIWEESSAAADGSNPTTLILFRGRLKKATRNPSGRSNRVLCLVGNIKSRLEVKMGLPAEAFCPWRFGDTNTCDINGVIALAGLVETGLVTGISGNAVTITGLAAHADLWWHSGYVEFDGLPIKIKSWKLATPTKFELIYPPRPEWDGEDVLVTPGCSKDIVACRRWANEANFGGIGFAIPDYHPIIDRP